MVKQYTSILATDKKSLEETMNRWCGFKVARCLGFPDNRDGGFYTDEYLEREVSLEKNDLTEEGKL